MAAAPITAFHGTPHKIEDGFRLDRIGTGEGAQSYGWGLYFAEEEAVGNSYRKSLSEAAVMVDDVPFRRSQGEQFREFALDRWFADWTDRERGYIANALFRFWYEIACHFEYPPSAARRAVNDIRKGIEEVQPGRTARLEARFEELAALVARPDFYDQRRWTADAERRDAIRFSRSEQRALHDLAGRVHWISPTVEDAPSRVIAALHQTIEVQKDWLARGDLDAERCIREARECLRLVYAGKVRFRVIEKPGYVYSVRLHVDAEALLDLDAALDEQPAKVRAALERLQVVADSPQIRMTGESAYRRLTERFGSKRGATEALVREGLDGIRYLDGVSRQGGEGTRNYVIFDEAAVEITHCNGAPLREEGFFPIEPARPCRETPIRAAA